MTRALVACRICYLLSVYDSANRDTRDDTFSLFTLAFGAFQEISNIFVNVEEITIFLVGNCKIEQQSYIFFLFSAPRSSIDFHLFGLLHRILFETSNFYFFVGSTDFYPFLYLFCSTDFNFFGRPRRIFFFRLLGQNRRLLYSFFAD